MNCRLSIFDFRLRGGHAATQAFLPAICLPDRQVGERWRSESHRVQSIRQECLSHQEASRG